MAAAPALLLCQLGDSRGSHLSRHERTQEVAASGQGRGHAAERRGRSSGTAGVHRGKLEVRSRRGEASVHRRRHRALVHADTDKHDLTATVEL